MIQVVAAVIAREGRILLTQRQPTSTYAYAWECPGGKVEPGETPHHALRRELAEELGAHVGLDQIGERPIVTVTVEPKSLPVAFYEVTGDIARACVLEGPPFGIGWFTADEMRRLTLTPGNALAMVEIGKCCVATWPTPKGRYATGAEVVDGMHGAVPDAFADWKPRE